MIPMVVLPDPDPTDDHALQAWVDVVADDVSLRLLVDTGTPRSALPHLEPFASRRSHITQGGSGVLGVSADEAVVAVHELVIGGSITRGLPVQLQPQGWPHPALLGMDMMGSHRCHFHFDDPRLDLDEAAPTNAGWIPLITDQHRTPTVEVVWGQVRSRAVWDTGAGVTVVDRSWARDHPDLVDIGDDIGHGTDVTDAHTSHPLGSLAACRIGNRSFGEQVCAVVDFSAVNAALESPIKVILGLPLIAQTSWCMDFPRRRWAN